MKLVLDASVALKWVLPETDSPKALSLRDDYKKGIHELISPDVFPIELAHALTRAERRGILKPPEAIAKLADVLATAPRLHACGPLLGHAAALSSNARIGVYDCLYVALAEREQCALVTADSRLKMVSQLYGILLSDLL
jgi:predicted nucleic acid-binding protein